MNIYISKYIYDLSAVRQITEQNFLPYNDIKIDKKKYEKNSYVLAWGDPVNKVKNGVMETGFFWDALHIDTIGLYTSCSLNTPQAQKAIENFKAPKSAKEIIFNGRFPPTKFRQAGGDYKWEGIVLPLQNPGDRSVHRGSSTEDYYSFVDNACKYYGKHLFLKLHPWNKGEVEARFRSSAKKYGSSIGRVNHTVIENCKFVLVYNSTFIIDCLIRGIKVAQYAPGYFWQTKPVLYTSYEYPDEVSTDINDGYKLCDFLVWKYLIYQGMSIEKWVKLIRHFANSKKLFPITNEFCYATHIME